ncbi:CPBP family glutamic-type intramembrane protease [Spirosoma arcticum]
MLTINTSSRALLLLPFFVLLFTRIGIEISVWVLPLRWAWLPAFAGYYLAIAITIRYANRYLGVSSPVVGKLLPPPSIHLILIGVMIPALLPLGVFVLNVQVVPLSMLMGIVGFALINPFFEDAFWRGLLAHVPLSRWGRILFSASLFSFSHYFLWGAYWLATPHILIPTCLTTFIMGVCWMWFYQRDQRLIYPIMSHMLVDVFNLSIAVFMGIPLPTVR